MTSIIQIFLYCSASKAMISIAYGIIYTASQVTTFLTITKQGQILGERYSKYVHKFFASTSI